jgi:7,8-dihydroneopterin aldolase/epimerase/oxygenase
MTVGRSAAAESRRYGMMKDQENAENEWIEIEELEIRSKIGVLEEERRNPQKLTVSLRFQLASSFASLADVFAQTIDYGAVVQEVSAISAANSRHLIETLAVDIADRLMERFPMARLEVVVRKFILPNTRYVSARTIRKRERR